MPELIGDVDELIGLIRRSATQSALDAQEEARQKTQKILDDAAQKIDQIRAQAQIEAEHNADVEHRRTLAQTDLEIQRRHLECREALLEQAWETAETRLRELVHDPDYEEVLQRLANAAAAVLDRQSVLLAADSDGHKLLTPERLAAWGEQSPFDFRRQEQPAKTWGGLIAADESGRCLVDNSFDVRLKLARNELRERVAEALGVQ
jgi:vacuolar-type H+-ATPase subunit E/Vma4